MTTAALHATTSPRQRQVRIHSEGALWVVTEPCPGPEGQAALARQPALLAPVKLAARAGGGLELCVELLNARGIDVGARANSALEYASAWLLGADAAHTDAGDALNLAEALAELPRAWAWEARPDGGFHVHATAFGTSARLRVEGQGHAARVFVSSAVPLASAESLEALVCFALEANARLRLARISVEARSDTAHLTWDAVASPGVALDRSVPAAAEAVAGAHATTRRALRALSHAEVARTYLETRSFRAQAPPA